MKFREARRVLGCLFSLLLGVSLLPLKGKDKAKEEPKRMPFQILTARTVHLEFSAEIQEDPFFVERCVKDWQHFQVLGSGKPADLNLSFDAWPPNTGLRLRVFDREHQHLLWTVMLRGVAGRFDCCVAVAMFHLQIRRELRRLGIVPKPGKRR